MGNSGRFSALGANPLQGAPGSIVDNAGNAKFPVALKFGDSAFRFSAKYAVDAGDGISCLLQFLLEKHYIVAV